MEMAYSFLLSSDLKYLEEVGTTLNYADQDTILEQGSTRQAIFVVQDGAVRVERRREGRAYPIADLGPGEIFGEISFVRGGGATAAVVAIGRTRVVVVEAVRVNGLLSSIPGFAARFYHSIATTLANRVEYTTNSIPELMDGD